MINQCVDRLYMGTWQLGGQFRPMTRESVFELLNFALLQGIRRFDTAIVYGNGRVESILGEVLPNEAWIITKVPAKRKPELNTSDPITQYYDETWITQNVEASLRRLRRNQIGTVLLHNWSRQWRADSIQPLSELQRLKNRGLIQRIGISLPNSFDDCLGEEIISHIDVVEAPLNPLDNWILNDLSSLREKGKEVIVRSLFLQGLLLKEKEELISFAPSDIRRSNIQKVKGFQKLDIAETLLQTWRLGISVAIGMTTKEQVVSNLRYLKLI